MKIAIKRVNKELEYREVNYRYQCELKEIIGLNSENGEMFDRVYLHPNNQLVLLVDEEGILKGLEHNFFIETSSPYSHFPMMDIVGDVIFAKFKPLNIFEDNYDYQLDELTQEDIQIIEQIAKRAEELDNLPQEAKKEIIKNQKKLYYREI